MSEAKFTRKPICAPEFGTGWRDADGNYAVVTGISVRYSWDNGEHAGDDVVDLAEFQETFKADTAAESAQPAERAGEWVSVDEGEAVALLTEAMRAADRAFEKVGGSTRHHVRDCLIPELERMGLAVTRPSAWIPRHERLPPLGVTVVVLRSGEAEPVAARLDDDGDWIDAETHEIRGVTHWVPLPPPPQPKEKP